MTPLVIFKILATIFVVNVPLLVVGVIIGDDIAWGPRLAVASALSCIASVVGVIIIGVWMI